MHADLPDGPDQTYNSDRHEGGCTGDDSFRRDNLRLPRLYGLALATDQNDDGQLPHVALLP